MSSEANRLTRIGVFYDGNYFLHVSNYYAYHHPRKARIDISGLHNFIKRKVSEAEGADEKHCQIVDSHYFRGRLRAHDAEEKDRLLKDRIFDDILMREGVTSHYLPLGAHGEKGIDVWLALEAYELAIYKRFDVSILVAGDGDFLPLVRKLNTIGTRVMLVCWDFKFEDQNGQERETKTAQALLEEVTYPVLMQQVIDDRSLKNDPIINGLFVQKTDYLPRPIPAQSAPTARNSNTVSTRADLAEPGKLKALEKNTGTITNLLQGFGFITPNGGGTNIFFFCTDVLNVEFNELEKGVCVEYEIGQNDRGPCARRVRMIES